MGVADAGRARLGHVSRVDTKIRHAQVAEQQAAVGVGIGAHAASALGRQLGQFGFQAPLRIEQFFWPIALEPVFQQPEVLGMGVRMERYLVRAEGAFDRHAVDVFRPGPTLGGRKDDHRPARTCRSAP